MANGESQKQLLSLIRDFATEKSHGERRVSDLKRRLLEIQSDFDAADADLERSKSYKETAEQELRGSQVQLAMTEASIQALEARIAQLQEEIFKMRTDLTKLKSEEDTERDDFISRMADLNVKIRNLWETCFQEFTKQEPHKLLRDGGEMVSYEDGSIKDLEGKIKCIDAQIHKLDEDYRRELHNHDEVCQELADIRRRGILVEGVMEETKILEELSGLTAELEKGYASLGEELHRKYRCPSCGFNNMGELEETQN